MLAPALLCLALASSPAPAPLSSAEGIFELDYRWALDGPLAGGAIALWAGSEAFKQNLAPAACRWCASNSFDEWGRGLRAPLASQGTADTWSNVVAFGLLPAAIAGSDLFLASRPGALNKVPVDLMIVAESAGLALLLDQGVKFAVGRERPFVHALAPDQKGGTAQPSDNNLSFFSGHSTLAFSLVVAAGTVAEERGYQGRALIWAVGLPLAATVPLLRIAADKHYLSDVLVGSAVGAAFGVAVPLWLHPRSRARSPLSARLVPLPQGAAVVGVF